MSWLAHKEVVFTGKAKLNGINVVRSDLEAYVERSGGYVGDKVTRGTDLLVASRTDTTKAAAAVDLGVRVCTYDEFWQLCGIRRIEDIQGGAAADPNTPFPVHVPLDDTTLDQAAANIEGWGTF